MMRNGLLIIGMLFSSFSLCLSVESGEDTLIIKYLGSDRTANIQYHDGQMSPAVGTQNYQILRANRTHPEWADNMGWTYNHAPNLAYWNGYFLCHYLSNPMGEHDPPGVTMLTRSKDGMDWEVPRIIFPIYYTSEPGGKYPEITYHYMHQRMGFYVAPDNRLLVMGFYGGNDGNGIGRVVREVYKDFTLGPVYFIRLNDNWKGEVKFPLYDQSPDKGFIEACEAFMQDKIRRIQWWEENYLSGQADTFYMPYERQKAFCFYTISDELTMGLFKSRYMTYTRNGGESWADPFRAESLTYGGAKVWGQKLDNGQYALVYNPTDASERHPLAVAVSDDGVHYEDLSVVHGEIPVKRYWGIEKRPGPQYVRGIVEGNGNPPGDDLWVVYSVSKEDIWISRIPVPIRRAVEGPVKDDFSEMDTGGAVAGWNIYAPKWCPVRIVNFPDISNKSLMLKDSDPYDYARATRVFGTADRQTITFDLYIEAIKDSISIDICDKGGSRLIQTLIDKEALMHISQGNGFMDKAMPLEEGKWHNVAFEINSGKSKYELFIDGESVARNCKFTAKGNVERIVFQTGTYRLDRNIQEYKSGDQTMPGWDEPGADEPVEKTVLYIRSFATAIN